MDIRSTFPSKYLGSADLSHMPSRSIKLTIAKVTIEELQNRDREPEQKPIVYFERAKKGLVLNKTNANKIGQHFGWNTDAWVGQQIELYIAEVEAFGETVEAIRVRVPRQAGSAAPLRRQTEPTQHDDDDLEPPPPTDNDIPF